MLSYEDYRDRHGFGVGEEDLTFSGLGRQGGVTTTNQLDKSIIFPASPPTRTTVHAPEAVIPDWLHRRLLAIVHAVDAAGMAWPSRIRHPPPFVSNAEPKSLFTNGQSGGEMQKKSLLDSDIMEFEYQCVDSKRCI